MSTDRNAGRVLAGALLIGLALTSCGRAPADEDVGVAREPLVWSERTVFARLARPCSGASAELGRGLALRGDALVVGAPGHCVTGEARGAVSVFDRSGVAWLETGLLLRPEGAGAERFGAPLVLGESVLAAASPSRGMVEIFERAGLRFVTVASYTASGGHGTSLAADDATVVAGAPDASVEGIAAGLVFVYRRMAEGGWELAQVIAPEAPAAGAGFGRSVALDGDRLAIASAGGVIVLERRSVAEPFAAPVTAAPGPAEGIAMAGSTLVVRGGGAISIHAFDDAAWSSLPLPSGFAGAPLGPLAIADGRLAVATDMGVFVSERTRGGWGAFEAVTGAGTDAIGLAVDRFELVVGYASGGVSAYQRVGAIGEPCASALGCESGFCVDGVCCESACGGGGIDCVACSVAAGSSSDGSCERAAAGSECRAATGVCDRAERCSGASDACPAEQLAPSGTVCRDVAGECDVAETCTGTSPYCPRDSFERVGVACRAPAGECDLAEVCNGLGPACPGDRLRAAGTVCRERAGECDVAEACDGSTAPCPRDGFLRYGFVCRTASGQCDADELCDGATATCPPDALAADGTECADGDACTMGDACEAGRCVAGPRMCAPPPERDAGVVPPPPPGGGGSCSAGAPRGSASWVGIALCALAFCAVRRKRGAMTSRRTALRIAACLAAALAGGTPSFAAAQDADGDGILDAADRCFGPDGADTDGDGWPSACDCAEGNPAIHPGAPDVCGGVDEDCDGRIDVHTAIAMTGAQLHSSIARGEARGSHSSLRGTLAVSSAGTLLVSQQGLVLDRGDIYYRRAVEFVNGAGDRVVHVRIDRAPRAGDHDFQFGFSDGREAIVVALSDVDGSGTQSRPSIKMVGLPTLAAFLLKGDNAVYETPPVAPVPEVDGTWYATLRFASNTITVSVRNATGVTRNFAIDRTASFPGPDRSRPWSFVLVGRPLQSYEVRSVAVFQDLPHPGGAIDADGDGYAAACDCDDADAGRFPGAAEICDEIDDDCDDTGDRRVVFGGDAAALASALRTGDGYPGDTHEASLVGDRWMAPATSLRPFLRVPLAIERDGRSARFAIDLDRDPLAGGDHNIYLWAIDSAGAVLGVTIEGAGDDYTAAAMRATQASGAIFTGPVSTARAPVGNGPYRIEMELGSAAQRFRVVGPGGMLEETTASTFDWQGPIEFVATTNLRPVSIRRLEISQLPYDSDGDGVCNDADRCAGAPDGATDADGDGVRELCDCNDRDPTRAPGLADACDGRDDDCDGLVDVATRFVAIGGPGFQAQVEAARASWGATPLTVSPEMVAWRGLMPGGLVLYRAPVRSVEHALEISLQNPRRDDIPAAIFVSDGTRGFVYGDFRIHGVYAFEDRGTSVRLDALLGSPANPGWSERTFRIVPGSPARIEVAGTSFDVGDFGADGLSVGIVAVGTISGPAAASFRATEVPADGDADAVCDLEDVCAGYADRDDADRDGIPDFCDPCIGVNGPDVDGDGVPAGCDCDDRDPAVHPGAGDACDGRDNDCDGTADRLGALVLAGGDIASRIGSGAATGNGRRMTVRDGGDAIEIAAFTGPSSDVYFRSPLGLLPPSGGEQRVRVRVNRDPQGGDHDFMIALTDGRRAFGVSLLDVGGSGQRYTATPFAAADRGDRLDTTEGTGQQLQEASPYTFDFVLGASPRIEVLSGTGESASLEMSAGAVGVMDGTALSLILVGNQPQESYVVRAIEVSQVHDDADADGVCDAIDRCAGVDDRGTDGDRDGFPDDCDICPRGDDALDSDGDRVPNACDTCDGNDDATDADADGIPDACDACPDDPANDFDADGVCDHSDVCLTGPDGDDADGDGTPDACDPCPRDGMDDADEDGTCDAGDVCEGDDRTGDNDGDGVCSDRDCDDTRASIAPGAEEICDGFDSDCDGVIPDDELDTDGDLVLECREPLAALGCHIGGASGSRFALIALGLALAIVSRRSRRARRGRARD